ncbi:MAG TPA: ABC transporter substrate-binding protein [Ilumatobacteraceae bacterium]|nr:ABC transporter substrate-binding protein [Ilumatobacteraceae bacterium]
MSFRRAALFLLIPVAALAACSSDATTSNPTDASGSTTAAAVETTVPAAPDTTEAPPDTIPEITPVAADAPFPADRCEANKAAGKITYLSSFDFAASASIVDVLVANEKGYFKDMCLDVTLKASFSTDNYPLIAANEAQFSSGGSFSEVVDYAGRNDAGFVALAVEGRTGIDALIVKDGQSTELADLKGKTIGVKGAITPSVAAMLKQAGLTEGKDYQTALLDGFDPKVHIAIPEIVGFPGFKSNEPLQLAAAGIPFKLYDPADYDIPGSFGVLYTNSTFLGDFPTATEDFMRASMKGLADAIADPDGAAAIAVDMINANGNALFLSPEGETARWGVESKLVSQSTASDLPIGVPDATLLQKEVTTYADIGLFDGQIPDFSTILNDKVVAAVYDDSGKVIWPSG